MPKIHQAFSVTAAVVSLFLCGEASAQNPAPAPEASAPSVQPQGQTPFTFQENIRRIADTLEGMYAQEGSAEESERSQRDLIAQEHMASWAKWAFIVSLLQFVVAIFTLLFLFFTFRETRKTAEAGIKAAVASEKAATAANGSLEISRLSERPWIGIELDNQQPFNEARSEVHFVIANYGRLPAIIDASNIGIVYGALVETPILDERCQISIGADSKTKDIVAYSPVTLKFRNENYEYTSGEIKFLAHASIPDISHNDRVYFYAVVGYRSVTGERGESRFCWRYEIGTSQWVKHGHDDLNFMK